MLEVHAQTCDHAFEAVWHYVLKFTNHNYVTTKSKQTSIRKICNLGIIAIKSKEGWLLTPANILVDI